MLKEPAIEKLPRTLLFLKAPSKTISPVLLGQLNLRDRAQTAIWVNAMLLLQPEA